MIPKSGVRFSDQDHAPRKKGRRSAERRMPSNVRTVPPRGEGVWKRSIADKFAQSAQFICLQGPLAFRRSAAALAPASERQDSAQAALHAKHDAKALPPLRIALKRGTSRPGHCAGRAQQFELAQTAYICLRCPDRPGAGLQAPPARTALAPSTGCHRSTSLT
jgi:hypothetical protein